MASFGSKGGVFSRGEYSVAFSGFAQLSRALRRVEDGVYPEFRQKLRDIGDKVALVAAGNAPRDTGELQHSIKTSVTLSGASVYSSSVYGGAINYGAWTQHGRGPHIRRASASHYMDKAVDETSGYVEAEMEAVLDWLTKTFEE